MPSWRTAPGWPRSLGFAPERLVTTPQVHGKGVLVVDETTAPAALQTRADILVSREPGFLLMQRFADCVPLLLWHKAARVVSVAHAGWRGTAIGVAGRAVEAVAELGGDPCGVRVGIGPSIGPCCFEVGQEVVEQIPGADDASSHRAERPTARRSLGGEPPPARRGRRARRPGGGGRRLHPLPAGHLLLAPRARLSRPAASGRRSDCPPMPDLRERIDRVRDQIADAAARAGRDPSTVTLIGASKTRSGRGDRRGRRRRHRPRRREPRPGGGREGRPGARRCWAVIRPGT